MLTAHVVSQLIRSLLTLAGICTLAYAIPYLIRRGWISGENATTRSKFVCEVCFCDTKKLKKFMDENNIPNV